jgi:photosystem II stability/assembly factor-like uncharacterized protein
MPKLKQLPTRARAARLLTLALLIASPFSGCLSDGGTEIPNEVRGTLYMASGTPAVNATVTLYPVSYVPGAPAAKKTAEPVKIRVQTDASGKFAIPNVPGGQYNVLASGSGNYAFQDSILIVGDGLRVLPADTLRAPGSVTATVKLQPQHSPQTVIVRVLGTDYYTNVKADGTFTLTLPNGNHHLNLTTILPNYVPLFVGVTARTGVDTVLSEPLELFYAGIPVVTGLQAMPDSAGNITLRWYKTGFAKTSAYLIFRDSLGSLIPSTTPHAATTDTLFVDTVYKKFPGVGEFSRRDTAAHTFTYSVRILDRTSEVGPTFHSLQATSIPPPASVRAQEGWFHAGTRSFYQLSFPTVAIGYAYEGTKFYKTTDGGTTWEMIGQAQDNYYALNFPTPTVGYATAGGKVFKLTGNSWAEVTPPGYPAPITFNALHFSGPDTGFVVGEQGTILKTTNGAATWTPLASGTTRNLYSVRCLNTNLCLAGGGVGAVVKTTNGGTDWTTQASGTTETVIELNVISNNLAYGATTSAAFLKTTDGGTTWSVRRPPPPLLEIRALRFINANTGFMVGTGGILKTTDGGETWVRDAHPTVNEFVSDVECVGENACYATGGYMGPYFLKRFVVP